MTTNATRAVSLAIKADRAAIWSALTDGSVSPAYCYGFAVESTWAVGASYQYTVGGQPVITGEIVRIEPNSSMTVTFRGAWVPEVAALPETVVTFSIDEPAMPSPGVQVLTLTHAGLPDTPVADAVMSGWVLILSGLKTLLETGTPLIAAA